MALSVPAVTLTGDPAKGHIGCLHNDSILRGQRMLAIVYSPEYVERQTGLQDDVSR